MNRILFEKSEITDGVAEFSGERAAHIVEVLHSEVGDTVKTGELDGKIGTGVVKKIESVESKDGKSYVIRLELSHTGESLQPWADLILAPPRPRVFKRLLPQLAAMGVGDIVLVGAKKVEKAFWGATVLKEENYRPLLVDGLMQSGTTIVPRLELRRNFVRFIREELDSLYPDSTRIVAHPYNAEPIGEPPQGRLLIAIGPEGGWTDEEVELLKSKGFQCRSLGGRILRTDTATIALLAKLNNETAEGK
ncbi:MAG: 16S rRNA (uracil(1498)-N(3))-methyltransferase [Kiritimatiellae bacterium]|jgi:RsmE family RNA methyltransferase|nr:16S rRNA (uracil(1498)-N(3))-methyltransferase [Kiritimatiellia bacterium]